MPSDSAALCLCGCGAGEQKKAPRRQLYYFTPKIVDSQCFGFFFSSLAPPFEFSPLATRSAVTAPPESLRNDSTLPPPRLVSGDQPRRLSPLWSQRQGWGTELNRFFLNLERGSKGETCRGEKEVVLAHNAEKTAATLNIKACVVAAAIKVPRCAEFTVMCRSGER